MKEVAPEKFEAVKSGDLDLRKAKKQVKQEAKQKEDSKAAATARRKLQKTEDRNVFHGDSFDLAKKIPDESCALIFTDPPYDRSSLSLFDDLGMLASRILVDGGSLVTFCGQYVIRQVIDLVAPEYTTEEIEAGRPRDDLLDDDGEPVFNEMRFFWINCCLHTGGVAQMREYGVKVRWKPMLWFVKGDFRRDRHTWVHDLVESKQEKDKHPWQQSELEAAYYIEQLTEAGELVVDPFCGGGTTAKAASDLGRQWWTADVNSQHVLTARRRLS